MLRAARYLGMNPAAAKRRQTPTTKIMTRPVLEIDRTGPRPLNGATKPLVANAMIMKIPRTPMIDVGKLSHLHLKVTLPENQFSTVFVVQILMRLTLKQL